MSLKLRKKEEKRRSKFLPSCLLPIFLLSCFDVSLLQATLEYQPQLSQLGFSVDAWKKKNQAVQAHLQKESDHSLAVGESKEELQKHRDHLSETVQRLREIDELRQLVQEKSQQSQNFFATSKHHYGDGKVLTNQYGQVQRIENEEKVDKDTGKSYRRNVTYQYRDNQADAPMKSYQEERWDILSNGYEERDRKSHTYWKADDFDEDDNVVRYHRIDRDAFGNNTNVYWDKGRYDDNGNVISFFETHVDPFGLTTTKSWENARYDEDDRLLFYEEVAVNPYGEKTTTTWRALSWNDDFSENYTEGTPYDDQGNVEGYVKEIYDHSRQKTERIEWKGSYIEDANVFKEETGGGEEDEGKGLLQEYQERHFSIENGQKTWEETVRWQIGDGYRSIDDMSWEERRHQYDDSGNVFQWTKVTSTRGEDDTIENWGHLSLNSFSLDFSFFTEDEVTHLTEIGYVDIYGGITVDDFSEFIAWYRAHQAIFSSGANIYLKQKILQQSTWAAYHNGETQNYVTEKFKVDSFGKVYDHEVNTYRSQYDGRDNLAQYQKSVQRLYIEEEAFFDDSFFQEKGNIDRLWNTLEGVNARLAFLDQKGVPFGQDNDYLLLKDFVQLYFDQIRQAFEQFEIRRDILYEVSVDDDDVAWDFEDISTALSWYFEGDEADVSEKAVILRKTFESEGPYVFSSYLEALQEDFESFLDEGERLLQRLDRGEVGDQEGSLLDFRDYATPNEDFRRLFLEDFYTVDQWVHKISDFTLRSQAKDYLETYLDSKYLRLFYEKYQNYDIRLDETLLYGIIEDDVLDFLGISGDDFVHLGIFEGYNDGTFSFIIEDEALLRERLEGTLSATTLDKLAFLFRRSQNPLWDDDGQMLMLFYRYGLIEEIDLLPFLLEGRTLSKDEKIEKLHTLRSMDIRIDTEELFPLAKTFYRVTEENWGGEELRRFLPQAIVNMPFFDLLVTNALIRPDQRGHYYWGYHYEEIEDYLQSLGYTEEFFTELKEIYDHSFLESVPLAVYDQDHQLLYSYQETEEHLYALDEGLEYVSFQESWDERDALYEDSYEKEIDRPVTALSEEDQDILRSFLDVDLYIDQGILVEKEGKISWKTSSKIEMKEMLIEMFDLEDTEENLIAWWLSQNFIRGERFKRQDVPESILVTLLEEGIVSQDEEEWQYLYWMIDEEDFYHRLLTHSLLRDPETKHPLLWNGVSIDVNDVDRRALEDQISSSYIVGHYSDQGVFAPYLYNGSLLLVDSMDTLLNDIYLQSIVADMDFGDGGLDSADFPKFLDYMLYEDKAFDDFIPHADTQMLETMDDLFFLIDMYTRSASEEVKVAGNLFHYKDKKGRVTYGEEPGIIIDIETSETETFVDGYDKDGNRTGYQNKVHTIQGGLVFDRSHVSSHLYHKILDAQLIVEPSFGHDTYWIVTSPSYLEDSLTRLAFDETEKKLIMNLFEKSLGEVSRYRYHYTYSDKQNITYTEEGLEVSFIEEGIEDNGDTYRLQRLETDYDTSNQQKKVVTKTEKNQGEVFFMRREDMRYNLQGELVAYKEASINQGQTSLSEYTNMNYDLLGRRTAFRLRQFSGDGAFVQEEYKYDIEYDQWGNETFYRADRYHPNSVLHDIEWKAKPLVLVRQNDDVRPLLYTNNFPIFVEDIAQGLLVAGEESFLITDERFQMFLQNVGIQTSQLIWEQHAYSEHGQLLGSYEKGFNSDLGVRYFNYKGGIVFETLAIDIKNLERMLGFIAPQADSETFMLDFIERGIFSMEEGKYLLLLDSFEDLQSFRAQLDIETWALLRMIFFYVHQKNVEKSAFQGEVKKNTYGEFVEPKFSYYEAEHNEEGLLMQAITTEYQYDSVWSDDGEELFSIQSSGQTISENTYENKVIHEDKVMDWLVAHLVREGAVYNFQGNSSVLYLRENLSLVGRWTAFFTPLLETQEDGKVDKLKVFQFFMNHFQGLQSTLAFEDSFFKFQVSSAEGLEENIKHLAEHEQFLWKEFHDYADERFLKTASLTISEKDNEFFVESWRGSYNEFGLLKETEQVKDMFSEEWADIRFHAEDLKKIAFILKNGGDFFTKEEIESLTLETDIQEERRERIVENLAHGEDVSEDLLFLLFHEDEGIVPAQGLNEDTKEIWDPEKIVAQQELLSQVLYQKGVSPSIDTMDWSTDDREAVEALGLIRTLGNFVVEVPLDQEYQKEKLSLLSLEQQNLFLQSSSSYLVRDREYQNRFSIDYEKEVIQGEEVSFGRILSYQERRTEEGSPLKYRHTYRENVLGSTFLIEGYKEDVHFFDETEGIDYWQSFLQRNDIYDERGQATSYLRLETDSYEEKRNLLSWDYVLPEVFQKTSIVIEGKEDSGEESFFMPREWFQEESFFQKMGESIPLTIILWEGDFQDNGQVYKFDEYRRQLGEERQKVFYSYDDVVRRIQSVGQAPTEDDLFFDMNEDGVVNDEDIPWVLAEGHLIDTVVYKDVVSEKNRLLTIYDDEGREISFVEEERQFQDEDILSRKERYGVVYNELNQIMNYTEKTDRYLVQDGLPRIALDQEYRQLGHILYDSLSRRVRDLTSMSKRFYGENDNFIHKEDTFVLNRDTRYNHSGQMIYTKEYKKENSRPDLLITTITDDIVYDQKDRRFSYKNHMNERGAAIQKKIDISFLEDDQSTEPSWFLDRLTEEEKERILFGEMIDFKEKVFDFFIDTEDLSPAEEDVLGDLLEARLNEESDDSSFLMFFSNLTQEKWIFLHSLLSLTQIPKKDEIIQHRKDIHTRRYETYYNFLGDEIVYGQYSYDEGNVTLNHKKRLATRYDREGEVRSYYEVSEQSGQTETLRMYTDFLPHDVWENILLDDDERKDILKNSLWQGEELVRAERDDETFYFTKAEWELISDQELYGSVEEGGLEELLIKVTLSDEGTQKEVHYFREEDWEQLSEEQKQIYSDRDEILTLKRGEEEQYLTYSQLLSWDTEMLSSWEVHTDSLEEYEGTKVLSSGDQVQTVFKREILNIKERIYHKDIAYNALGQEISKTVETFSSTKPGVLQREDIFDSIYDFAGRMVSQVKDTYLIGEGTLRRRYELPESLSVLLPSDLLFSFHMNGFVDLKEERFLEEKWNKISELVAEDFDEIQILTPLYEEGELKQMTIKAQDYEEKTQLYSFDRLYTDRIVYNMFGQELSKKERQQSATSPQVMTDVTEMGKSYNLFGQLVSYRRQETQQSLLEPTFTLVSLDDLKERVHALKRYAETLSDPFAYLNLLDELRSSSDLYEWPQHVQSYLLEATIDSFSRQAFENLLVIDFLKDFHKDEWSLFDYNQDGHIALLDIEEIFFGSYTEELVLREVQKNHIHQKTYMHRMETFYDDLGQVRSYKESSVNTQNPEKKTYTKKDQISYDAMRRESASRETVTEVGVYDHEIQGFYEIPRSWDEDILINEEGELQTLWGSWWSEGFALLDEEGQETFLAGSETRLSFETHLIYFFPELKDIYDALNVLSPLSSDAQAIFQIIGSLLEEPFSNLDTKRENLEEVVLQFFENDQLFHQEEDIFLELKSFIQEGKVFRLRRSDETLLQDMSEDALKRMVKDNVVERLVVELSQGSFYRVLDDVVDDQEYYTSFEIKNVLRNFFTRVDRRNK